MAKKIARTPIHFSDHACAVVHIFERSDRMDDIWMHDHEDLWQERYDRSKEAAEQLISQLGEQWNVLFMNALVEKTFDTLLEHDKTYNTRHTDRLITKLNEMHSKL